MKRYDLVIFDLDGVLVDSAAVHERAYERLWRACGLQGPPYQDIAGRSTRSVVEEVTRSLEPSQARLAEWVRFKQECARELLRSADVVFEDVPAALEQLRRAGVRLAVATSASATTAAEVLERGGLRELFACVVTVDQVRAAKPDPEIYLQTMSRCSAPPGRCLVVEDSSVGLQAGLASGADVACVRSGLEADGRGWVGTFADLPSLCRAVTAAPTACGCS